jgi:hypothetical protein
MVVDADRIYLAGRYNAANFLIGGQGLLASFSKATGDHLADTRWGPGGLTMDDALGLATDGRSLYTVGISSDQARHTASQIVLRCYTKDLHLEWEQAWGGSKGESARIGHGPGWRSAGRGDDGELWRRERHRAAALHVCRQAGV